MAPPAASDGAPEEPARSRGPRRSRGRLALAIGAGVVGLALVLVLGGLGVGWWRWSQLREVDVSSALSARDGRAGTNYLIVGLDSRAGISADDPDAGVFLGGEVSGARTDTLLVLHMQGSQSMLTSVPRDLWVTDPATGQKGRINSTFAKGPGNLVTAVTDLGIPIDHYLQIDFVSFGHLVDQLGGVTVDFPAPARDTHSGLSVERPGPTRLDGASALAYVRSRYYEEAVDGRWRMDPTADIGRMIRQRAFLDALLRRATSVRNPFVLWGLPGALGPGLVHDTTLGYRKALALGWELRDTDPEPVPLPVVPRRTSGGADVLDPGPGWSEVVARLAG